MPLHRPMLVDSTRAEKGSISSHPRAHRTRRGEWDLVAEIEDILSQHPGVSKAAVIGVAGRAVG